jgi:hypothetical protein
MSVSFDTLHWTHLGAALAHAIQAGYTFVLANDKFKNQGYFTITNNTTRSVSKVGKAFNLANLVGVFPTLSVFNHLYAFLNRDQYEKYVNDGYNPVRWIEYGGSAGVMLMVISMLSEQTDIKLLTSQAIGNVALQYIGYMVEKQVSFAMLNPVDKSQYYENGVNLEAIGLLVFGALWVPIMTSFFTAVSSPEQETDENADSDVDGAPESVWSIIFIMTALLLSFGVLSILYLKSIGNVKTRWCIKDFKKVELGYIILSFVAKTFLTNMTLFGVLFSAEEDSVDDNITLSKEELSV